MKYDVQHLKLGQQIEQQTREHHQIYNATAEKGNNLVL